MPRMALSNLTLVLQLPFVFFSGGSPHDLGPLFGLLSSKVYKCVEIVVNTINKCNELSISFPESHEAQEKIAKEFQNKSQANFDSCVGCLDGMMIWFEKPS